MTEIDVTTSSLLPIVRRPIGTDTVQTIDGRALHSFLQIAKEYATWMKVWIRKAHLVEHRDYAVFSLEGRNLQGGRPRIEYVLTLDAAKCVGMMSGTVKGDEVRAYFLACEKQVEQQAPTLPTLHDPAYQMLMQAVIDLDTTRHQVALIEARQHTQAVAMIEQQQKTIEALQRAIQAEGKADLALEDARRTTVEEFVIKHGLYRQFPPPTHGRLSAWLKDYCQRFALPVRKAPVTGKPWDEENSYPLEAFGALMRAETTKPRQITLVKEEEA
jgi:phage anti-repressor protein